MKVLHLSVSDIDGGAARGSYQLHKALQRLGVESKMLVAQKVSTDPSVIGPTEQAKELILNSLRPVIDRWPLRHYPHKTTHVFSPAIFPTQILPKVQQINPDIIHLQWVNKGFIHPASLPKFKKPLVWTLRDMWTFTGGCHYTEGCEKYQQHCGACPQLGSTKERDLSRDLWQRKAKHWADLHLHLVPVSQWLADCVAASSLFRHYPRTVIGTTIDTTIFVPRSRPVCRDFLHLERDRQYILFGALNPTKDPRKGFRYLQAALQNLRHLENTELLLLGADQFPQDLDLGLPSRCLGKLFDDLTLSIAYNAADVVVVPSTQDACPKTALEALACSIPVACFDSTGLKDMVIHQVNGYRAQCFEPQDLAHGIEWILSRDRDTLHSLWAHARQTIEDQFLPEHQAQKYLEIYEPMLRSP